jgi:hypothetical protein
VGTCEVYVGIVAWRYGSTPPGSVKSFTHLEYEEAVRLRKQVLLFHLDEQASWPTVHVDRSQSEVRRLRKIQERDHIVDHFADLDQLSGGVRRALHRLLGESTVPVPNLLPYIANRHAQQDELARAASGERLDLSPSVVVLHGAAGQAHHKFAEFMQEQLLARYLRAPGPVHMFPIALRATELDQPDVITMAAGEHLLPDVRRCRGRARCGLRRWSSDRSGRGGSGRPDQHPVPAAEQRW